MLTKRDQEHAMLEFIFFHEPLQNRFCALLDRLVQQVVQAVMAPRDDPLCHFDPPTD